MKRCKFCDLKFNPSCTAQKFCCEDCKKRYNNALKRRRKKPVTEKPLTLAEVNQRARDKGLTYGQYAARYL